VVRLDGGAWTFEADTLDNVRVECTLKQPLDLALVRLCRLELGGLRLEHVDERVANDPALLLWVLHALQAGQEQIRRVDDRQVHAEIFVEHLVHLRRLILTEHAIIDHDGMKSSKLKDAPAFEQTK
jgi:hypothetical protein